MCGVCGFLADEQHRPSHGQIAERLRGIESRGRDASGFAMTIDQKLWRYRAPLPASQVVSRINMRVSDSKTWIGHTRLATHGLAKNNNNNHPFIADGLALVHNGIIQDYDKHASSFTQLEGECDSELILRFIVKHHQRKGVTGAIQKMSRGLQGDMACALINRAGHLWLWRRESSGIPFTPLHVVYDGNGALHFASTQQCLKQSLPKRLHNEIEELPNNTGAHFWLGNGRVRCAKFFVAEDNTGIWSNWLDDDNRGFDPARSNWTKKVAWPKSTPLESVFNPIVMNVARFPVELDPDSLYECDNCGEWLMADEVFSHKTTKKHNTFVRYET